MVLSLSNYSGAHAVLRWQPLAQLPNQRRPRPDLRRWIEDKGSLTAKLIAISQGTFKVQVVRQRTAKPTLSEQRCLGLRRGELALVREVVLSGNNRPWIFARSVLPLSSLTGRLRHLRKQDARPLGAFLFSQPHLQRSAITASCISRQHGYVPDNLYKGNSLWGRRSVFYLDNKPLLVSEVFLDAFTEQLNAEE